MARMVILSWALYFQCSVQAALCDGIFRQIASKYYDGYEIQQAEACFPSGKCVVLLNKYRQRQVNHFRATAVLGNTGRVVSNPNPFVNCHSFACSMAGVPLPTNAWLNDGEDFLVIQRQFFYNTGLSFDARNLSEFGYSRLLQTGDLVLLNGQSYIHHSGIVVKEGNFNWVRSKLDEDWVVDTPIENLWNPYQVVEVHILRRRPR